MHRSTPALLLLLAFFFVPKTIHAQQQSDTLFQKMEPIQINALRSSISPQQAPLSLSISQRSLESINSTIGLTLDEITRTTPGIWVNDRQTYALGERITIRGMGWRAAFGVRGIQVIMDDIPLTVADGQAMLNSVDPSFIRRTELIRGPSSTFWGNSSGGVLYLSTLPASEDLPFLRLRSSMGSYGMIKEDIQMSKSYGNHKVTGYGSYFSEDGYRNHSAAEIVRTGIKGRYSFDNKSSLEYMGAFVAMPYAEHPSSLTEQQLEEDPEQANPAFSQADAGKEVYQGQLGLNYYRDTSIGFLTFTGYAIRRELSNPLPFGIIDLNRWAGGSRGTIEKEFNGLSLKSGFELKYQHDDRAEYDNDDGSRGAVQIDQLEKVANQALFATANVDFGKFSLLNGLRYDRITFRTEDSGGSQSGKRTFEALSPSIGLSFRADPFKLFANFSTAFEAPTTTELVNNPEGNEGFNPNLKPERTVGLETGAKGELVEKLLSFDIALFSMWIDNLLFPYQLEANGPTYYRNQGKTRHRGFETLLSLDITQKLNLTTSYSYIQASFIDAEAENGQSLDGGEVPGIPTHRLNMSARYTTSKILAEVSYEYVGEYAVNNLNTAFNDSYGVVDLKFSLFNFIGGDDFSLQPYINVHNLFDRSYSGSASINAFGDRYFEPAPGRNWQAGISANFY